MSKEIFIRIGLVFGSIVGGLFLAELSVRAYYHCLLDWDSFLGRSLRAPLLTTRRPVQADPMLGWVNRTRNSNGWMSGYDIDRDGFRSNENPEISTQTNPILAVGDSFTFGDDVGNRETWPSFLERKLNHRVINGGVSAYGLDQIFLRAQQLVPQVKPRALVFSWYVDDVTRAGLKRMSGMNKPYFRLHEGSLQYVPPAVDTSVRRLETLRLLHRSALFTLLVQKYFHDFSFASEIAPTDAVLVSRQIARDLQRWATARALPLLAIVQWAPYDLRRGPQPRDAVIKAFHDAGIDTLDLRPLLVELQTQNPERFHSLFRNHMTPAGNEWVAEKVAERLALLLQKISAVEPASVTQLCNSSANLGKNTPFSRHRMCKGSPKEKLGG